VASARAKATADKAARRLGHARNGLADGSPLCYFRSPEIPGAQACCRHRGTDLGTTDVSGVHRDQERSFHGRSGALSGRDRPGAWASAKRRSVPSVWRAADRVLFEPAAVARARTGARPWSTPAPVAPNRHRWPSSTPNQCRTPSRRRRPRRPSSPGGRAGNARRRRPRHRQLSSDSRALRVAGVCPTLLTLWWPAGPCALVSDPW